MSFYHLRPVGSSFVIIRRMSLLAFACRCRFSFPSHTHAKTIGKREWYGRGFAIFFAMALHFPHVTPCVCMRFVPTGFSVVHKMKRKNGKEIPKNQQPVLAAGWFLGRGRTNLDSSIFSPVPRHAVTELLKGEDRRMRCE